MITKIFVYHTSLRSLFITSVKLSGFYLTYNFIDGPRLNVNYFGCK